VLVFDAATGKQVSTCDTKILAEAARAKFGNNGFMAISGGITDVAFSPDARILTGALASGEAGSIHLWDARSGKELYRFTVDFCPQAIAFSRDGSLLAASGAMGPFNLRVWDVAALTSPGSQAPFEVSQFGDLWKDLAGEDLTRAFRAERIMSSAAAGTLLPLMQKNLKPVQEPTEAMRKIAQLVADLDSERFEVRDKATKELPKLGNDAVAALKSALKDNSPVEFQRRAQGILTKLEENPAPLTAEQRQQQRALAILESLGTPAARQFIEQLANGTPEAWLTQEARTVRQRSAGESR
jgi:hypothetical protein